MLWELKRLQVIDYFVYLFITLQKPIQLVSIWKFYFYNLDALSWGNSPGLSFLSFYRYFTDILSIYRYIIYTILQVNFFGYNSKMVNFNLRFLQADYQKLIKILSLKFCSI